MVDFLDLFFPKEFALGLFGARQLHAVEALWRGLLGFQCHLLLPHEFLPKQRRWM